MSWNCINSVDTVKREIQRCGQSRAQQNCFVAFMVNDSLRSVLDSNKYFDVDGLDLSRVHRKVSYTTG